eukprot:TRINITY_DN97492_c0_g1_i1.p1 TRINITY_DN97492_c0_g1~~TRINITY_DN97492_c0_g1_i1.p1  ORF type:complete len:295 (-),score=6.42 TRINITY_DN97492_c0_g1_i1:75-881(-)
MAVGQLERFWGWKTKPEAGFSLAHEITPINNTHHILFDNSKNRAKGYARMISIDRTTKTTTQTVPATIAPSHYMGFVSPFPAYADSATGITDYPLLLSHSPSSATTLIFALNRSDPTKTARHDLWRGRYRKPTMGVNKNADLLWISYRAQLLFAYPVLFVREAGNPAPKQPRRTKGKKTAPHHKPQTGTDCEKVQLTISCWENRYKSYKTKGKVVVRDKHDKVTHSLEVQFPAYWQPAVVSIPTTELPYPTNITCTNEEDLTAVAIVN